MGFTDGYKQWSCYNIFMYLLHLSSASQSPSKLNRKNEGPQNIFKWQGIISGNNTTNKNISPVICLSYKILDKRIILSKLISGRHKKKILKIPSQTVCHQSWSIILHIMSQLMISDMYLYDFRTEKNILKLVNIIITIIFFFWKRYSVVPKNSVPL